MSKGRLLILVLALVGVIIWQFQITGRLRHDLADTREKLREQTAAAPDQTPSVASTQAVSAGNESTPEQTQNRLRELESEVMRLRGAASRALRAEAEVAQLKSQLGGSRTASAPADSDPAASTNAFVAYLGDTVQPPPNIDPAYTKDGLLNAVTRAAQLASVPLKKLDIESSEFPFLAGVVCESDAEFEKLKEQFKTMPSYEYGGAVSSHGVFVFNITPHRAYPPDSAQRISRRTTLRQQIFFDQLTSRAN